MNDMQTRLNKAEQQVRKERELSLVLAKVGTWCGNTLTAGARAHPCVLNDQARVRVGAEQQEGDAGRPEYA